MPHNHITGLYFNKDRQRIYLPQVELRSHTTISPVCLTTKLTQIFDNPNDAVLAQVRYTFPLYDGVAVNGYTISYGDKTIRGVVQQKDQAKKTYQTAFHRGETAGLLESLPAGIFGVTLGNVPAKVGITVDITYCGELKHDAAIDGLRYMLPTSIAPRYGAYPGEVLNSNAMARGISITVDVDMASSAVRRVQSPSHPISVSMGALSTADGDKKASFIPSQASATLTQGSTELGGDFVLQLLVDDINRPQAILEAHPDLQHQRALMTTLVPNFSLPPANPEIMFIADQSGSMQGSKNASLVKALKIFLKSLPFGVRFNICAFGDNFKFLFPTSQAYNEDNLQAALSFVEGFHAGYGGTEILNPIAAAFEQRLADLPLEVMLLTDGEVWGERKVFRHIDMQISEKKVDARVFALGIGTDVSHSLVEGVARAGNGFAQFVTQDEETDQKVMRMLKAALYAHTKDHEIEVHYNDKAETRMSDEDDFEIVEKVNDCLNIDDRTQDGPSTGSKDAQAQQVTSFFDLSKDNGKTAETNKQTDRYAHLPNIATPKLLQAPSTIPPLFHSNRTTLYLLLGPETPQKQVKSVTLRATSAHGPLALEIPVHAAAKTDVPTIHQLAARMATHELEQGRGWLHAASVGGENVKTKFASRFDELVERECVRLGEKFQVAGRWTSFVAVQSGDEGEEKRIEPTVKRSVNCSIQLPTPQQGIEQKRSLRLGPVHPSHFDGVPSSSGGSGLSGAASTASTSGGLFGLATAASTSTSGGLFGPATSQSAATSSGLFSAKAARPVLNNTFASAAGSHDPVGTALLTRSTSSKLPQAAPPAMSCARGGNVSVFAPVGQSYNPTSPSYSPVSPAYSPTSPVPKEEAEESDDDMGYALFDDDDDSDSSDDGAARFLRVASDDSDSDNENIPEVQVDPAVMEAYRAEMQDAAAMPLPTDGDPDLGSRPPAAKKAKKAASPSSGDDSQIMTALIDLQTFSGAWGWSAQLLALLRVSEADVRAALGGTTEDETVMATGLAIAFLERRLAGKKEVWEFVAGKAMVYLRHTLRGSEAKEDLVGKMKGLF